MYPTCQAINRISQDESIIPLKQWKYIGEDRVPSQLHSHETTTFKALITKAGITRDQF